jgi:3-methyl-2-oxobutanoate hydroxymethyltransferase
VSTPPKGKLALPELAAMKKRGDKIVMVTAYDAPGARFAEDAGVDIILVGDTAAMVVLGHEGTTVPVTMDEMLFLTRTVARAARRPIVVGDMPFGSFQVSDEKALENAIRFVKEAGADAIKLEGAGPMVSRVRTIVEAGIPVMGHVGLTPQSATMLGGFKTQGKTADAAKKLVEGALALEDAGAFSVVLEAVPAPVAAEVTSRLTVPTIGIGAGPDTDGQVLVYHDLPERPEVTRENQRVEDAVAGPGVRAADPKQVVPVDADAHRPHEEQGRRERRRGKRYDVAGLAKRRTGAQPAGDGEDEQSENEVDDRAVRQTPEERPGHDSEGRVTDLEVVHDLCGRRTREHAGDSRQDHKSKDGLLPGLGRVVRVVAQSREGLPRMREHGQRAEPPLTLEGTARLHGGTHTLSVACVRCLKQRSSSRCPRPSRSSAHGARSTTGPPSAACRLMSRCSIRSSRRNVSKTRSSRTSATSSPRRRHSRSTWRGSRASLTSPG